MSVNPFMNSQKTLPKQDSQIVRVDFEVEEIGGRKSNMPSTEKNSKLAVKHVQSGS